jgi:hypothetical protein
VWACTRCGGGLDVIQQNADAHGLDWRQLIDKPALLGPPLQARQRPADAALAPLPRDWLRRCALAVRRDPAPTEYLQTDRGVARRVLLAAGVGWDAATGVNTFPVWFDGRLVAYKTRRPEPGADMWNCPGSGRRWSLYPWLPESGEVIVVEGELDALCGLSHRLPCASVTLGVSNWLPEWTEDLVGLRVGVCFDNDAQRWAMQRVKTLRAADIDAYRVRLPRRLGPKGDLSDYINKGGDVSQLRRRERKT